MYKQGNMVALRQSIPVCTSGLNMEVEMNISRSLKSVIVLMWKIFSADVMKTLCIYVRYFSGHMCLVTNFRKIVGVTLVTKM